MRFPMLFSWLFKCKKVLLQATAWFALAFCVVLPAAATTVSGLYEASVSVADRGEKARNDGFANALAVVAVRVSGARDAAARLGSNLGNARRFVQRFGYATNGQLQVGFDGDAVNRMLTDAGLAVWGRERPLTLVCLQTNSGWITAGSSGSERQSVEAAALRRGLPVVWPTASPDDAVLSGGTAAQLHELAGRYGADALLVGRGVGTDAASWSFHTGNDNATADGAPTTGVDLAADTLARFYASSGSTIGETLVYVSGIAGLKAYADTLNYLEALTQVRSVAVDQVNGDVVHFRLAVRGDPQTLKRAIALDRRLSVAQTDDAGSAPSDHLSFRYQP
jgi:hypothetical protein